METAILKHSCKKKISNPGTKPRTSCILTRSSLYYTTEANIIDIGFSSVPAEHKYMKYKFRKRLFDAELKPVTFSMHANHLFHPLHYQAWTCMYTFQWSYLCLRNSLKIATRICQFSQYLEAKLDMLFEIAKSVEIVIVLGKAATLP